ncbi:MAG: uroporphyrinogen-III synthase [candidate division NC10 bacterium]|nr:uroporphyrinogen-III synthase [candidate division NC10 bacterium]
MRLEGRTVAITGSRRASELAQLVAKFGGVPYIAPTVGIEVQEETGRQVDALADRIVGGEFDYAVFMTGPSVYLLVSRAGERGLQQQVVERLNRLTVVARSHKPQKVLETYGVRVALVPSDNTAEGIAAAMAPIPLGGKRVAVLWHGAPVPVLRETLERKGAEVFEAQAYTYAAALGERGAEVLGALGFAYVSPEHQKVLDLIRDVIEGSIQIITFTSPPAARNLFRLATDSGRLEALRGALNAGVLVVAVGPPTRQAIEAFGVRVDVMPDVYKMGPMVRAIVDYVAGPLPTRAKQIPALVPLTAPPDR